MLDGWVGAGLVCVLLFVLVEVWVLLLDVVDDDDEEVPAVSV